RQDSMKHLGRVDEFPSLPYFMVRGREIDITPNAINSIYSVEPIALRTEFMEQIATNGNQLKWVASTITTTRPIWASLGRKIPRHDLRFKAKMWLDL
ncbi:hypothetical protein HAX54_020428, partial [Datura stramonium]|nr:hypothetical protein [Datura stramonium]